MLKKLLILLVIFLILLAIYIGCGYFIHGVILTIIGIILGVVFLIKALEMLGISL